MRFLSGLAIFGTLLATFDCAPTLPAISNVDYVRNWMPESTFVLLDVRTQKEWEDSTGHLENAILLPIGELEEEPASARQFLGKKVIVYCRSGGRSSRGTRILREQGVEAFSLEGGIRAWRDQGHPVVVETARDTTRTTR